MRPPFASLLLCLLAALLAAPLAAQEAKEQIPARLADIRTAILARNADGIVRWGTDDWHVVDRSGAIVEREAYLTRTRALFARIEIESLDTQIDLIDVAGKEAAVEITQTMVRREKDPATGKSQRWRVHYRERQSWTLTADGWRVAQVAFIGDSDRRELPEA